jgi:hypothetical protein
MEVDLLQEMTLVRAFHVRCFRKSEKQFSDGPLEEFGLAPRLQIEHKQTSATRNPPYYETSKCFESYEVCLTAKYTHSKC